MTPEQLSENNERETNAQVSITQSKYLNIRSNLPRNISLACLQEL